MTRVCFVGQRTYFAACALEDGLVGGITTCFVDHRGGADPGPMLAAVREAAPDVVVVFRPEVVPPGAFAGLDALTLGFNTEPLPRGTDASVHPDQLWRLSELAQTDASNFDRLITFDPLSADAAARAGLPVWRSVPLPVADTVFDRAPREQRPGRKVLFVGYSTKHREAWLVDAKHHYDVLHVAHGMHGEQLLERFGRTDVAINLHGEPYPSFENRVCLHLAAGHLVLSEPLSPSHGLEPGIDFLEVRSPKMLLLALERLSLDPSLFDTVRRRGRRKAEQFRASRVWPRLLGDLRRDVAAFGGRAAGPRG